MELSVVTQYTMVSCRSYLLFVFKYIGTRNKSRVNHPLKIKVKSVDKNFGKACQFLLFFLFKYSQILSFAITLFTRGKCMFFFSLKRPI